MRSVALSPSQELAWMAETAGQGQRQYYFAARIWIRGPLDTTALEHALHDVVSSREAFRLYVVDDAPGLPRQRAFGPGEIATPLTFATGADGLASDLDVLFDITRPPLVRWVLRSLGSDEWVLTHVEHHLVHDGKSFALFLKELFEAYAGRAAGRQPALADEQGYLAYAEASSASCPEAFEDVCDRVSAVLERTGGRATRAPQGDRPVTPAEAGPAQVRTQVPGAVLQGLRQAAADERVTPFSIFLGSWARLLAACTGVGEVVVGTTVDVRPRRFADSYGMFVNTVPVTLAAAADRRQHFGDLLDATERRDVPIHHLTRRLGLRAQHGANPLFETLVSLHESPLPPRVAGLEVRVEECVPIGASKFPLDVLLVPEGNRDFGGPRGGGSLLVCDFDQSRYSTAYVTTLLDRYVDDLADLVSTGRGTGWPLSRLEAAGAGGAPAGGITQWFAATVRQRPSEVCLVRGDTALTFAEAAAEVEGYAQELRSIGAGPGSLVALTQPAGPQLVLWELACLTIGAVFLPLGRRADRARLRAVLDELEIDVEVDEGGARRARAATRARPAKLPCGYVALTSGSTARPRAVLVSHDALTEVVAALVEQYRLAPGDKALALADAAFDLHLEESLPALLAGACVVYPPGNRPGGVELLDLCESAGVTVVNMNAGYAEAVVASRRAPTEVEPGDGQRPGRGVRLVVLGSERVTPRLVREVSEVFGEARLLNAYGLTESCITSTVGECAPVDDARAVVHVGGPIAGLSAAVVNPAGVPVPEGVAGELVLEGDALATGYLAGGALVPLDGARPGQRRLATGDLATISDGAVTIHGRIDDEVKVRGVRGRLPDVEDRLVALLGVAWCAAVRIGTGPGEHVVACLPSSVRQEHDRLAAAAETLRAEVDEAFVPQRWSFFDQAWRLPSGKLDRARFEERVASTVPVPQATAGDHLSRPEVATGIRDAWAATLRHDDVGADTDFFDIGGHSLVANEVSARLDGVFGRRPPTRLLYTHPRFDDYVGAVVEFLTSSPQRTSS